MVIAGWETALQVVGPVAGMLALVTLLAAAVLVVRSQRATVADAAAATWKGYAEAEKAERTRLGELVDANRVELERLREQAPGFLAIAEQLRAVEHRLAGQNDNGHALAQTIARIDQSLQLVVREQGERRKEYRGPIQIDPLTVTDPGDQV